MNGFRTEAEFSPATLARIAGRLHETVCARVGYGVVEPVATAG